jgi:hypothetical protein
MSNSNSWQSANDGRGVTLPGEEGGRHYTAFCKCGGIVRRPRLDDAKGGTANDARTQLQRTKADR